MDDAAAAFCELFPAVYLRFCRRHDDETSRLTRLTSQQDAVLHHLAMSGPLTVGEMSRHFARAQSVVSEIVDGLETKGLLERMRDARDRRRTLVWLTDEAREVLARRRQVLDPSRVARAMRALPEPERTSLVRVAARAGARSSARAVGRDPETEKEEEDPMSNHACESCGMPIEAGPYCQYCIDEKGQLQPFDERFERMVQWQ